MYNDISSRIEKQESKDRYVAKKCLEKIIKDGWNLKMEGTKDAFCPVDLTCTATSRYDKDFLFNVEIKERYKNDYQLQNYPYAELKHDKLIRMRRATDYDSTRLYYMVLLNYNTCYLFDLDDIDWENIETFVWHIKKTQFDNDSEVYEDALTYKLPYHLAKAKCDCSEFYREFCHNT
jgi:hypothetical protein